jgi:diapolycopene oxygenase
MNLLPWVQMGFGLWYVQGGLYNLARGFARLMEELGVRVRYNAEVVRILHEQRRVSGVRLASGEEQTADAVVSNMEVIPAYERLLHMPRRFMRSLDRFEPSCSGLVLHLGLDTVYPQLAHHNFIYSNNERRHFDLVFNRHALPTDPTIYAVAPTHTDPTQAPEGCDALKLLPHIPYLDPRCPVSEEEYEQLAERVIDKMQTVGLRDIRRHIVVRDLWTPRDIESHYYSNRGSIYGVVSDWRKNLAMKAPKRSRVFRGLYFVGGSVNPGGGMPMVCLSGQKAAALLARELGST